MSTPDGGAIQATTNLDHQRFEQVEKDKVYFHAEQASEEFEEDGQLETLSLRQLREGHAEEKRAFGEALRRGMADLGFVYLTDHGIDPALFEEADRRTQEFFERTPEAEKIRFLAQRHGSVNQGYFPYKKTTQAHPDLVQGWVFASRAFNLNDRTSAEGELSKFWPDPADERFYRRLYQALEPIAIPLMRSILEGFGCPADLYDERLTNTLCAIRLNYYPGFILCGWSTGGLLASAMACRLEDLGRAPERLILLDTHLSAREPEDEDPENLRAFFARTVGLDHPDTGAAGLERRWQVFRRLVESSSLYRPRAHRCPIVLIQAEAAPQSLRDRQVEACRSLTLGPFEVLTVAADHQGLLRPPAIFEVADLVAQEMVEHATV